MLLIGAVMAVTLGTQFGAWSEGQAAGLQIAQLPNEIDVTSTIGEPILLAAWGDLKQGDCVLWPAGDDLPVLPTVTDCRSQHDGEISAVNILPGTEWPFHEDGPNLADACKESFPSYVGRQFDVSKWHVGWIAPTQDEWEGGDHSYQCYVYLREGQNSLRAYQSGT